MSGERTKKSKGSLCIKHGNFFLKKEFSMLSDFAEGQDLSECPSVKKITRLDKELKRRFYIFLFVSLIQN